MAIAALSQQLLEEVSAISRDCPRPVNVLAGFYGDKQSTWLRIEYRDPLEHAIQAEFLGFDIFRGDHLIRFAAYRALLTGDDNEVWQADGAAYRRAKSEE